MLSLINLQVRQLFKKQSKFGFLISLIDSERQKNSYSYNFAN